MQGSARAAAVPAEAARCFSARDPGRGGPASPARAAPARGSRALAPACDRPRASPHRPGARFAPEQLGPCSRVSLGFQPRVIRGRVAGRRGRSCPLPRRRGRTAVVPAPRQSRCVARVAPRCRRWGSRPGGWGRAEHPSGSLPARSRLPLSPMRSWDGSRGQRWPRLWPGSARGSGTLLPPARRGAARARGTQPGAAQRGGKGPCRRGVWCLSNW